MSAAIRVFTLAVVAGAPGFRKRSLGFEKHHQWRTPAAKCDPNACSQVDQIGSSRKRAVQKNGANTGRQIQRLERVAAGESDEELVIAGALDEIVAAQVTTQAICEFLKGLISDFVAMFFVDSGEAGPGRATLMQDSHKAELEFLVGSHNQNSLAGRGEWYKLIYRQKNCSS